MTGKPGELLLLPRCVGVSPGHSTFLFYSSTGPPKIEPTNIIQNVHNEYVYTLQRLELGSGGSDTSSEASTVGDYACGVVVAVNSSH